jgi:hypothetical protein
MGDRAGYLLMLKTWPKSVHMQTVVEKLEGGLCLATSRSGGKVAKVSIVEVRFRFRHWGKVKVGLDCCT